MHHLCMEMQEWEVLGGLQCRGRWCLFLEQKKSSITDEVGYDFVYHLLNMQCSFSAFCKSYTRNYQELHDQAQFVSLPTFLSWFFSWSAAFGYDFRKDVHPFCGSNPDILVGDGTHVGVAVRNTNLTPIDTPDDDRKVPVLCALVFAWKKTKFDFTLSTLATDNEKRFFLCVFCFFFEHTGYEIRQ